MSYIIPCQDFDREMILANPAKHTSDPDMLPLTARKHDFAGALDLHRERAEMRKMPDSNLLF